jgi:hypothetical protein
MGYWAELNDDNEVIQVIAADSDYIATLPGTWIETSDKKKDFAGIGYTYNSAKKTFRAKQPFPSWTYDERDMRWNPPKNKPTDGKPYSWDEESKSWTSL